MLGVDDPTKVLARCRIPLLSAREEHERIRNMNNVVFASGGMVEPEGKVKLYYGGADTVVAVATARFNDIIGQTTHEGPDTQERIPSVEPGEKVA
jgi:predicted GH43/DUF377 family glycosyl hydrolase